MAEAANVLVFATSGKTLVRWNIQDVPEGESCRLHITE